MSDTMKSAWIVMLCGCDAVFGLSGRDELDDGPVPEVCGADARYASIPDGPARSTYRIVETNPVSWSFAFSDCQDDSLTGITHLIVFDDVTELSFVQASSPSRPKGTWFAWSGFARNWGDPPLEFTSVTGVKLEQSSLLWSLGEPNNGGPPTTSNPQPMPETVTWWGNNLGGLIDAPWEYNGIEGYICECDGQATNHVVFDVRPPP